MNFYDNYASEAKQYAVFPVDRSLEYTVLGLVGEVGELISAMGSLEFENLATDPVTYMAAFKHRKDEEGDVWWYLAAVADAIEAPFSLVCDEEKNSQPQDIELDEICFQLGKAIGDVAGAAKKSLRDDNGVLTAARAEKILNGLVDIADILMTISSNHRAVMTANLNKLEARKRAGTIKGDGDNR